MKRRLLQREKLNPNHKLSNASLGRQRFHVIQHQPPNKITVQKILSLSNIPQYLPQLFSSSIYTQLPAERVPPSSASLKISRLNLLFTPYVFIIQRTLPAVSTKEHLIWVKTFQLRPQMVLVLNVLQQTTH